MLGICIARCLLSKSKHIMQMPYICDAEIETGSDGLTQK